MRRSDGSVLSGLFKSGLLGGTPQLSRHKAPPVTTIRTTHKASPLTTLHHRDEHQIFINLAELAVNTIHVTIGIKQPEDPSHQPQQTYLISQLLVNLASNVSGNPLRRPALCYLCVKLASGAQL